MGTPSVTMPERTDMEPEVKEVDGTPSEEVKEEGEPIQLEDPELKEGEPAVETTPPDTSKDAITPEKIEVEKLKKQLKDKEDFVNRQSREVALARQEAEILKSIASVRPANRAYANYTEEQLNDVAREDPVGFHKEMQSRAVDLHTNQALHAQYIAIANEREVRRVVPEIDSIKEDIAKLAKLDGRDDSQIAGFLANPFSGSDPQIVISYASRVRTQKELEALKAQKIKQDEDALSRVASAASAKQGLTASSGTGGTSVSAVNLGSMDSAARKAYLARERQKEGLY